MATSPLISVSELAPILTDEATLVIDCRFDVARPAWGPEQYAAEHVPGAVYANLDTDLASAPTAESGRHPLPDPAVFAAWIGGLGVDAAVTVVAYDQGPGMIAARLWWLLRAAGHLSVRVLDGGLAAWTAAGHPVTSDVPVVRAAKRFPVAPFAGWLTTDDVVRRFGRDGITLVDARAADRYAGQNETIDPVAGHIAGALSRPFSANVGPDGTFLPAETLAAQWSELLGSRPVTELVASCGSGITACHHLLALEAAGMPGASLYAGSFSEWIRDPARPVATGAR